MYKVDKEIEYFEFEVGGEKYKVPTLQCLPLNKFREMQRRVREADERRTEEEAVYALLDIFDELAPGCTDQLTYLQAAELVKAYTVGEELGES